MLASEMRAISSESRNNNDGFNKQWEEMMTEIRNTAQEGKNYCVMIYGKYDEQLIEKLRENGFKVMRKMELFTNIPYGAICCMTHYVVW